jgi:hypothetical protein
LQLRFIAFSSAFFNFPGRLLKLKFYLLKGIIVYIHNQTELPESTEGIFLTPGVYTNIGLKKSFNTFTAKPYSTCEDLSSFKFDRTYYNAILAKSLTYTQSACLDICLSESNAYALCLTKCPLECSSQEFLFTISSSGYPSNNYAKYLNSSKFVFNKLKNTTTTSSIKSNVLSLFIYFDENKYSLVQQRPQYQYWDIFSITGGNTSLLLGFSALAIVQLFDLLIELFMVYWEWRKSKKVSKGKKKEKNHVSLY